MLTEYMIGEKIAEGAFGAVYNISDLETNTPQAVKLVDKVEMPVQMIKDEADMMQSLDHDNIVKFSKVFYERCFVAIIMERYRYSLFTGMQIYWRDGKKIPCGKMVFIGKQMALALEYLHSKSIVHRDIKGDNFLMDRDDIDDKDLVVALSDFGMACMLAQGERLQSGTGSQTSWAPEIFSGDYGHKIDIWAMGVIMYGLLDGHLPFSDQDDVKNKNIVFPKGTSSDCEDFVRSMLIRDEGERLSAAELVQHKWVVTEEQAPDTSKVEELEPTENGLQEAGADEGVQARRKELLDRLENEKDCQEQRRVPKELRIQVEHYWAEWFAIADAFTANSTLKFEWWSEEKVEEEGILDLSAAQPDAVTSTSSEVIKAHAEDLRRLMIDYDINVHKFGKQKAKSFNELAAEVQGGSARMMLDATRHKKLVRVVDIVRLKLCPPGARHSKYLVEWSQQFPDGRKRVGFRLPETQKEAYENTKQTGQRILTDMLGMGDVKVDFQYQDVDVFEEELESPLYPGLTTVFRIEILEGQIADGLDEAKLFSIGLPRGANWDCQDSQKHAYFMCWLTFRQAFSKEVKLKIPDSVAESSGVVEAPIGLSEKQLIEYLQARDVDVSQFGEGKAKSIQDISKELIKGDSILMEDENGKVRRVVEVVAVRIINSETQGLLVQTEQEHSDGSKSIVNRLPQAKRRSDENLLHTVWRILKGTLKMDLIHTDLDVNSVMVIEAEKDSASYPGLLTVIRKRFITANLVNVVKC